MKVALLFAFIALALAKECGKGYKGCSSGMCCSYWGYCGSSSDYCGSGSYQCVCDCKGKNPCKSSSSSSPSCTNYKTTTSLNVRSGPSTSYSIKKTLTKGATVCVVSTSNGWAKLKDGNYVSAKYIKIASKKKEDTSNDSQKDTPTKTKSKLDNLTFKHPEPNVNSLKRLSLWATGYYTPVYKAGGNYALRTKSGQALAYVSQKQWCACAMEGSCAVKSGSTTTTYNYATSTSSYTVDCSAYYPKISSYRNCKVKFQKAAGIYGDGAAFPLVPFRSIAVDKSTISYGTVLYIPKAKGTKITLPDGTTRVHDGYFIAADTGGAIKGKHIDVFFGNTNPVSKNVFSSWVTSSSSKTFSAYVVTNKSIINEIKTFSNSLKN